MAEEPPPPDRIISPRKTPCRSRIALPIIAIDSGADRAFIERTGEYLEGGKILGRFYGEPPSLVIAPNAPALLKKLDDIYGDFPGWQFKLSNIEKSMRHVTTGKPNHYTRIHMSVAFWGFTTKQRKASRYFFPLDPMVLANSTIWNLRDTGTEIERLVSWGKSVREFCIVNNLIPRPTKGGLASQLLRDPRFFPEKRRKVPSATNAKARDKLPGNFYGLYCDSRSGPGNASGRIRGWSATYLDQRSAHHFAAKGIAFPNPNNLYAVGNYNALKDFPWAPRDSNRLERILKCHGLLYVNLEVPNSCASKNSFVPPYMVTPGFHRVFIYTNELPLIRSLGGRVEYVIAGWVSPDTSGGLNRYAKWALSELERIDPEDKPWIKPTLLATYGILATKPRRMEFGWKIANGGEVREFVAGADVIKVMVKSTKKEIEPAFTNVIYRGMIEAETRASALTMARELTAGGHRVLAIYADGIIIESSDRLPLLPPPWRVETHLTNLSFEAPTMFVSRELSKLPGVPRQHQRETAQRIARLRLGKEPDPAIVEGRS